MFLLQCVIMKTSDGQYWTQLFVVRNLEGFGHKLEAQDIVQNYLDYSGPDYPASQFMYSKSGKSGSFHCPHLTDLMWNLLVMPVLPLRSTQSFLESPGQSVILEVVGDRTPDKPSRGRIVADQVAPVITVKKSPPLVLGTQLPHYTQGASYLIQLRGQLL